MDYLEIRSTIREGDIIAQSHRSWKTWYDIQIMLIRIFTLSEYTHVGVVIEQDGRLFVIEAVTPRIRIVPLSQIGDFYLVKNYIWSPKSRAYAFSQIGGLYSKWEAVKGLFNRTNAKNKRWQCAELVREALAATASSVRETSAVPAAIVRLLQEGLGNGVIFVKGSK